MSIKKIKKCCVCNKPVFSVHSMYCATHARLAFRMKSRRFPPEAEEAVWNYIRKYGDRCHYTKILLEMDDIHSPRYCVFDHLIPLDPRTIVLTCALINEMKTALSEDEFWFYVEQLDDFKQEGKPIKKIRLAHWRQHSQEGDSPLEPPQEKILPGKKPIWIHPKDKKCDICGRPVFSLQSKYCLRCSHFNKRLELKKFPPEVEEDIRQYLRTYGYVCAFTGIALDTEKFRSPWYCVFNYLTPGDHSKVVLTCALFNEMKSDLTIKEFWYFIRQLANYKRNGTKVRMKKPRYWYRLIQSRARGLKAFGIESLKLF